jgi:PAS domain S-box-containing protein
LDRNTAQNAEIFRALFETAPDAMLVVGQDGRIALANGNAGRMFGWHHAALVGQPVETLIPQRFHASHLRHRASYAATPSPRPMGAGLTLYGRRADGSEFPVEIALSPIQVGGERAYAASVRDVSELARTKQAAQRGRYNAYVAQFGMQALAEPDFVALIRAAAPLIAEAMRADAVLVFRLTQERSDLECIASFGLSSADLARLHARNDPAVEIGHTIAHRVPVRVRDFDQETRFRALPEIRALGLRSALCVPLFGRGDLIGALSVRGRLPRDWDDDDSHFLQSVAHIVSMAIQRTAAEEHLLHMLRLESLGQLTGGVAHDFNNLLMVITGNLQMLEDVSQDRPEALELAQQAASAAERGAMLTRKLLAFARKQTLNPRAFDLNQLVSEVRELIQRTLGENIAVRAALDAALPALLADPAQVETALVNLALNARDAMPLGGQLTVETRRVSMDEDLIAADPELKPGDYAMLGVTDSGTGMAPEVARRAFEPFFTTKGAGKGSGLGLSMVYGFARQSGGTARIYSEPGHGTSVKLYLPLPKESQHAETVSRRIALPRGSETVLVVEDEAQVRNVAMAFLTRLGYRVLQAEDSAAALALLEREPGIALLFTDVVLPGGDGVSLARDARRQRPQLAVLYTSGYASGNVLDRIPEAEREHLISKPYRREELAFKLRQALARRI